jgi:Fe-S-cluster containining protein
MTLVPKKATNRRPNRAIGKQAHRRNGLAEQLSARTVIGTMRDRRFALSDNTLFLSEEQALKSVILDFRGYGAQPMLFCEVLRMLFGETLIFKREAGREGLWIADGRLKMSWLEGGDLVEYMCRVVQAAEGPPERLAALCSLVFQTPCRVGENPRTGRKGIVVQTDMSEFECRQCGECCRALAYHDGMAAEDVAHLKKHGRKDILKWVRESKTSDGRTVYRIWVTPETNQYERPCPFLKHGPSPDRWICRIHEVKPQICRNYPVSRKHAVMTGCPGFDRDVKGNELESKSGRRRAGSRRE